MLLYRAGSMVEGIPSGLTVVGIGEGRKLREGLIWNSTTLNALILIKVLSAGWEAWNLLRT